MSDTDFLKKLVREINDKNTFLADDGISSSEFDGTIDTGSYLFNAQLSGSLFGGMPNNKILGLAGQEATGKTFFAYAFVRQYLADNPGSFCFYYDTESAVTKAMFKENNIDPSRVIIVEKDTVQSFNTHALKMLDAYLMKPSSERPKIMMVLDSLGQLSTTKEIADITEGTGKKDMTRTQLIRAAFRTISLRVAKARCPFIVTNHTYAPIGAMGPQRDTIAGGGGMKYAASQIVQFSKKLDRDGKEVVGGIIHCFLYKSRFTKEKTQIDVKLSYNRGLDRYYGLFDFAYARGAFKKEGQKYSWLESPDLIYRKEIDDDPAAWWTREKLEQLEPFAAKRFKYGQGDDDGGSRPDETEPEVETDE